MEGSFTVDATFFRFKITESKITDYGSWYSGLIARGVSIIVFNLSINSVSGNKELWVQYTQRDRWVKVDLCMSVWGKVFIEALEECLIEQILIGESDEV